MRPKKTRPARDRARWNSKAAPGAAAAQLPELELDRLLLLEVP